MTNCCASPASSQSWIDWIHAAPTSPYDLILNAMLGATPGAFVNSTNFNSATWSASSVVVRTGTTPQVVALESDNMLKVADAAQWNFQHLTANLSATLASPLAKVLFLRGLMDWQNNVTLDLGSTPFTNIQLSMRDNAGTRGDAQGTIPVFQWTGSFSGATVFSFTFKQFGRFVMGLRCDTGSAVSMYESEWIIVP